MELRRALRDLPDAGEASADAFAPRRLKGNTLQGAHERSGSYLNAAVEIVPCRRLA
jgi:hypothetical protein